MSYGKWLAPVVLAAAPLTWAANKNAESPDKEMLRLIEFLKEMEMLKQWDLLKELQEIDAGEPGKSTNAEPASLQKKGSLK